MTDYHALRAPWTPARPSLVLLFESPPVSGKYFYDEAEGGTLFSAVMQLFGWRQVTKATGLARLRDNGIVLLDATYRPVNATTRAQRRQVMREDYPALRERLPDCPILVGMTGVLDAIGRQLQADGFEVLNYRNGQEVRVPFPANGWQQAFHTLARGLIIQGEA